MPKRQSKSLDFEEEIESRFQNLVAVKEESIEVIPTGSISLDVSLGVGGIPLRRFTEIYGSEGSAKTTLALSIAKNAILKGYRVLYCDPEQGLDLGRAQQLIGDEVYDQDKFMLIQPETMEETLHICEIAIKSHEFGLVILDSIASMAPQIVKEKELDDFTMGIISRRLGVFMTRNLYNVRNNDVAFVGLNQVRDKFGAFGAFVPTFDTPGGHQWKHDCSIRIMLSRAAEIKQGQDKIGIQVRFVVKKNKVAPPFRAFTFPVLFSTGVDSIRDLIDFAETMGVIRKAHGHYMFEGSSLGNGTVNTVAYLNEHKDTLDNITNQCYNLTNKSISVIEEIDEYAEELED
jgi:recombination protein RecA